MNLGGFGWKYDKDALSILDDGQSNLKNIEPIKMPI